MERKGNNVLTENKTKGKMEMIIGILTIIFGIYKFRIFGIYPIIGGIIIFIFGKIQYWYYNK